MLEENQELPQKGCGGKGDLRHQQCWAGRQPVEVEIPYLPQILTFSSVSLKNETFSEGRSRECSQVPQVSDGHCGCLLGKESPQESHGVGDGAMCQPQPRLCSLGILCWKHILCGHPIKRRSRVSWAPTNNGAVQLYTSRGYEKHRLGKTNIS